MGQGDRGGDLHELPPIVSGLAETAREARMELSEELELGQRELEAGRTDIEALRAELSATRRELRKLEQYVVALEEQVDEDD